MLAVLLMGPLGRFPSNILPLPFLPFVLYTRERERERERASERVSDNGRKRKGRREDNRRSGVGGTWSESWPLLAGTGF
jgi:hypothetical protein